MISLFSDGNFSTNEHKLENVRSVSFGEKHTLALDTQGLVWARGKGLA